MIHCTADSIQGIEGCWTLLGQEVCLALCRGVHCCKEQQTDAVHQCVREYHTQCLLVWLEGNDSHLNLGYWSRSGFDSWKDGTVKPVVALYLLAIFHNYALCILSAMYMITSFREYFQCKCEMAGQCTQQQFSSLVGIAWKGDGIPFLRAWSYADGIWLAFYNVSSKSITRAPNR